MLCSEIFYLPLAYRRSFVGRQEERRNLLRILERHGALLLVSMGGAGKTQLMVSFAECAREHGLVPGGIFCVVADRNKEKVLSSFVQFVQSLVQFALPMEDKSCTRGVVCSLRRALGKVAGPWLLCVDNADSADTGDILGEIAELAGSNGWLVATSRRGAPELWPGMTEDKLLRLEPVSQEEAFAVRWRREKGNPRYFEDDAQVLCDIERLKHEITVDCGGTR